MKVMLLAAGRGERMRPLTDDMPKPLLQIDDRPLLEWHIRRLAAAGLRDLVVNVSYLGQQIIDYFGDGGRWGVSIAWSIEDRPLETAGGIINALPLLGERPFAVVNADIWTDYDFARLLTRRPERRGADLVLVDNPVQHPRGDFTLTEQGLVRSRQASGRACTYAGIGVYSADFFAATMPGRAPLLPLLNRAIERGILRGEFYSGRWQDVGTPDRLRALDRAVRENCGNS